MIAPAKPLSRRAHHSLNKKFETKMLRRIRLMALRAFSDKNRELRYELTAEVVARAYAAFVRLAQQGRAHVGYATPLALFSIRQVRRGRRLGTRSNIKDISSEYARSTSASPFSGWITTTKKTPAGRKLSWRTRKAGRPRSPPPASNSPLGCEH